VVREVRLNYEDMISGAPVPPESYFSTEFGKAWLKERGVEGTIKRLTMWDDVFRRQLVYVIEVEDGSI